MLNLFGPKMNFSSLWSDVFPPNDTLFKIEDSRYPCWVVTNWYVDINSFFFCPINDTFYWCGNKPLVWCDANFSSFFFCCSFAIFVWNAEKERIKKKKRKKQRGMIREKETGITSIHKSGLKPHVDCLHGGSLYSNRNRKLINSIQSIRMCYYYDESLMISTEMNNENWTITRILSYFMHLSLSSLLIVEIWLRYFFFICSENKIIDVRRFS